MPISPPLYFLPKTVEEYIGAFTAKVLSQLGISPDRGWRSEEFA
jgi:3-polyprenyl-4-hydroxybenzoate decarboxylase